MTELDALIDLPDGEKDKLGVRYTPTEIRQQPRMWRETWKRISQERARLRAFLAEAGLSRGAPVTMLLLGAGTSEHIGDALAGSLRSHLGIEVASVPTTSFVTHPHRFILPGRSYIFVSFARSGESPESLGAYAHARTVAPEARHLIVTCNKEGRLALEPRRNDRALVVTLPDETNDRSLVMTSSFSSMVLAGVCIGHLESLDAYRPIVDAVAQAAEALFTNAVGRIKEFSAIDCERIQFLGTDVLYGSMKECRLKVLEMTNGRIAANVDSFLGLRHGPQVFIDDRCLVVAALSGDDYKRRYELDLLAELREKRQGRGTLVICDRDEGYVGEVCDACIEVGRPGASISDELRPVTDVVVGQLIGLSKSLALGLAPDNPSAGGVIHRVVSGVTIYPLGGSHAADP